MERATHNVKDAALLVTRALPSAASSTVYSNGIDLGALTGRGMRPSNVELVVEAPALNSSQLPNGTTMKYSVQQDDDPAFGSPETLFADAIVQTGAGGIGAGSVVGRGRLPSDCKRYLRLSIQSGTGTGNASGATAEMSLRF